MNTLFYIHDPMCSWCWAFRPTLAALKQQLPPGIETKSLLGGLAPDCDEPMPRELRDTIQGAWRRIQQRVPGTEFNFDFWQTTVPRRSTYPACRAVIAARLQGDEHEAPMILAIQQAYYTRALNPSDNETLVQLAEELQLDSRRFAGDIDSPRVQQLFEHEMEQARAMGVNSYPSLVFCHGDSRWPVAIDYNHVEPMLETLAMLMDE